MRILCFNIKFQHFNLFCLMLHSFSLLESLEFPVRPYLWTHFLLKKFKMLDMAFQPHQHPRVFWSSLTTWMMSTHHLKKHHQDRDLAGHWPEARLCRTGTRLLSCHQMPLKARPRHPRLWAKKHKTNFMNLRRHWFFGWQIRKCVR